MNNNCRYIWTDAVAVVILIALGIWLFRFEFHDYIWIGNPDRLNSDLKITQYYLSHSPIQAWNTHEMMGYDSFSLPYIYPHFLIPLLKWFGVEKEYLVMGYLVIGLLICAGISAYVCIRAFVGSSLAALTAAICYQLSNLTLLKVSQNAMSFCVFIIIPLSIWCLRSMTQRNIAYMFLFLSILLGVMLEFMFLQKASYALLFIGLYACWRSFVQKSIHPFFIFFVSLLVAIIFAGPRVAGIFEVIKEYSRTTSQINLKNFSELYQFQNIQPYEILRWFDHNIFGRFPSDAATIGNNINLTEGVLIYTSAIVPFVLFWGGINYLIRIKRGANFRSDYLFFSIIFICCLLVIVWPVATEGLFLLFLKMDFTHARILIIGLMAQVILLAGVLTQIKPITRNYTQSKQVFIMLISICFGLLLYLIVEHYTIDAMKWLPTESFGLNIKAIYLPSLHRIQASSIIFLLLTLLTVIYFIPDDCRQIAYGALCFFIVFQCCNNANITINGSQNFNVNNPFFKGDMYYARALEFSKPTTEQLLKLHQRIKPNLYRVALICNEKLAGGFCAGHVPEYWDLRAIDGYYGIGVPKRLRILPWPNGPELRTLSFSSLNDIPWELLGFLNVKYVLIAKDGLYRNIISDNNQIVSRSEPSTFTVVFSPANVTPRAFFAESVQSVDSVNQAVQALFKNGKITNPEKISFVERIHRTLPINNTIHDSPTVNDNGDDLYVHFKPSLKERFLVLNELYSARWSAEANDEKLSVYPANVVMRGVVVPPNIDTIHFYYRALSTTYTAQILQISSLILLCLIFFFLQRKFKQ